MAGERGGRSEAPARPPRGGGSSRGEVPIGYGGPESPDVTVACGNGFPIGVAISPDAWIIPPYAGGVGSLGFCALEAEDHHNNS